MKKLFLIFAAAVALSSVAFAEPYGEKSRPDSAGDIVFADGTATAWREGLTLTDAQKKAAVAVIFYAGTECSNGGERRVLGVGLRNATDSDNPLQWAKSNAGFRQELHCDPVYAKRIWGRKSEYSNIHRRLRRKRQLAGSL